jgi:hypothetical protein
MSMGVGQGAGNDPRYGTADDLFDQDAYLSEHGCVLMRDLRPVDGDDAVEVVAAQFRAENGSPGASLGMGQDLYLFRIDDLETALSDPAPSSQSDYPLPAPGSPSREVCLRYQGGMLMMRVAREIEHEELFEPVPARFVRNRTDVISDWRFCPDDADPLESIQAQFDP